LPTKPILGGGSITIHEEPIIYVGCIFIDNGQLYYGNMKNIITGDLLYELKAIIGE